VTFSRTYSSGMCSLPALRAAVIRPSFRPMKSQRIVLEWCNAVLVVIAVFGFIGATHSTINHGNAVGATTLISYHLSLHKSLGPSRLITAILIPVPVNLLSSQEANEPLQCRLLIELRSVPL